MAPQTQQSEQHHDIKPKEENDGSPHDNQIQLPLHIREPAALSNAANGVDTTSSEEAGVSTDSSSNHSSDPDLESPHQAVLDDVDSGYGDSLANNATIAGSTHSLAQHLFEYRHGRRYHGLNAGSYSFPNDEPEQARLDMLHYVFGKLIGDQLSVAPLGEASCPAPAVLDIGTGTGAWPIQVADALPSASVVGVDLSPIQPSWVPPNVRFVVDDVELDWNPDDTYDFIHCRYMAASVRDWPRLIDNIFQHLRPGGWLELSESVNRLYAWPNGHDDKLVSVDTDDSSAAPRPWTPLPDDHPHTRLLSSLETACERTGRTLNPAPSFRQWAQDAGFRPVRERSIPLPIGCWPSDARLRELGSLMALNFIEGVDAFTADLFTTVLGWSAAEVTALNADVCAAAGSTFSDPDEPRPVFDYLVVTAQKPY